MCVLNDMISKLKSLRNKGESFSGESDGEALKQSAFGLEFFLVRFSRLL